MSEARVSMATELRAPKGFAALYQDKSCDIPVILSASESGMDPQAERMFAALRNEYNKNKSFPIASNFSNGVSPFLIAGTPVPMYSSVSLHIPAIVADKGETQQPYIYRLIWRVRTFATSVASNGAPFHARNSSPGPSYNGDGQLFNPIVGPAWSGDCTKRLPIYGAENSIVYAQTEPTTNDAAFQKVYASYSLPIKVQASGNTQKPLLPAFVPGQYAQADIVQGFRETISEGVDHIAYLERALGDELCVLVYREPSGPADVWDFTDEDSAFLLYYSRDFTSGQRNRNYGLLVNTGVAP